MSDYEALRELAEAATPGPWGNGGRGVGTAYFDGRPERVVADCHVGSDLVRSEDPQEWLPAMRQDTANGEFIAAANPTAVLGLLDRIQALGAAYDDLEAARLETMDQRDEWRRRAEAAEATLARLRAIPAMSDDELIAALEEPR